MLKRIILMAVILTTIASAKAAQVGQWTTFLPYWEISDIEPGQNKIFVLASKSLFSYNTADNSVEEYNKANSLNDTDISHIAWCNDAKRLVIVYEDYNIDLLDEQGNVVNMAQYYNKVMTTSKNIKNISVNGVYAYLTTDFGIVKINVKKAEISNTYMLDDEIDDAVSMNGYIYTITHTIKDNNDSITRMGYIIKGKETDNLLNKENWHKTEEEHTFNRIFNVNGTLMTASPYYIVKYLNLPDREFQPIYIHGSNPNIMQTFCNNNGKLIGSGTNYAVVVDENTVKEMKPEDISVMVYDKQRNSYWTNYQTNSLQNVTIDDNQQLTATVTGIKMDGPKWNYHFFSGFFGNKLYTTGGGFSKGSPLNRKGCIQRWDGESWFIFPEEFDTGNSSVYYNVSGVAVDPRDENHVMASSRQGIYEFQDGKFINQFNYKNSPLTFVNPNDPYNYTIVHCVLYDSEGNLWVFHNYRSKNVMLYTKDGEWIDKTPQALTSAAISTGGLISLRTPFFDRNGKLWFTNDDYRIPSLISYDPKTEDTHIYNRFINQDGTEVSLSSGGSPGVRCAAEDKDGNIWIGTNLGPLMLSSSEIASGGETFTQVKVPRNDGTNFADYLLTGVDISCMAVDEANRKWFGTYSNGAYLISADNIEEVHHFTTANSPLLDNAIESITVNSKTGEVFFGTPKGLCSYKSEATQAAEEMTKDDVYAYPNPVRPDYTGPITITGLSQNADVRIVTTNGYLVAKGTSTGGSYIWNGRDMNGKRVASGVYMVMTATADGKKGTVCKIAVIN